MYLLLQCTTMWRVGATQYVGERCHPQPEERKADYSGRPEPLKGYRCADEHSKKMAETILVDNLSAEEHWGAEEH